MRILLLLRVRIEFIFIYIYERKKEERSSGRVISTNFTSKIPFSKFRSSRRWIPKRRVSMLTRSNQFEGLEIVSPILESHSRPLHFPRPSHLSKEERKKSRSIFDSVEGRGWRGFDPAKGHISLRGVIPRNSVSTIRETLRINLYGGKRLSSSTEIRGEAVEVVERWSEGGREGGWGGGRKKVVSNGRGTGGGRSGIHRFDGDRNKKEMLNVMPGSFHELAIFEGRWWRLAWMRC